MVIQLNHNTIKTFQKIGFNIPYYEFLIHNENTSRVITNTDDILEKYGDAKWEIISLLNSHYSHVLQTPFDLYNWLHFNKEDEVAYFLNEIGSNTLNYSEFKTPHKICLWLGKGGFLISIEQKGKGFNAKEVFEKGIKENKGAGFNFLKESRSTVYFDDPKDTKVVYLEHIF